jgi:aspartyl-tRNA synthetase
LEELLSVEELRRRIGQRVTVSGWVHDVRLLGGISFVLLRNSKGIFQVTVPKKSVAANVAELVTTLHQEDIITAMGLIKESEVARNGFEMIPESILLRSTSAVPLPLDPRGVTEANLDTRLSWRSLDLRRPEIAAIFSIQDAIISGFENTLRDDGFLRVFTPSIIGGISEGGAEVFKIDFYGKEAFLRQDPQLHRQLAIAGGLGKIYDLGPSWRAEFSHTPRHISEHRTIAPELSFVTDERDTMRVEEGMIVGGLREVSSRCRFELDLLKLSISPPKVPFPELTFPDIYEIIERRGHPLARGGDLDRESEKLLTEYVKEKFDSDFFFVNRFPSKVKPFYVMRVDDQPEFARSVDLVYKGLELSSGGQREHRYSKLMEQVKERVVNPEEIRWFTDVFKYGVPPHGGFSFGIERFTASLLNLGSVKEAALFPRDPERLQP